MSNNEILDIRLDCLPPTINHYYRTGRNSVRYKTKAGSDFQKLVVGVMKDALLKSDQLVPYEGRVSVFITMTAKDRRRWDLDNRLKAVQDCLQIAGVLKDDSQIDELWITREPMPKRDETRIKVLKREGDPVVTPKRKSGFRVSLNRGEGGQK